MGRECGTHERNDKWILGSGEEREGNDALDLDVEGRIVSKWILKMWEGLWNGFIGTGQGKVTDDFVYTVMKVPCSIKCGEFFTG
jgi:hypothetical protein